MMNEINFLSYLSKRQRFFLLICLSFLLFGCSSKKKEPTKTSIEIAYQLQEPKAPGSVLGQRINLVQNKSVYYTSIHFKEIPDWSMQFFEKTLSSFQKSCTKLINQTQWYAVCLKAKQVPLKRQEAKDFFENNFTPWSVSNGQGGMNGKVTGYYEPGLEGSVSRSENAQYPIYGIPNDFVSVALPAHFIHKKGMVRIAKTGNQTAVISESGNYTANLNKFPISNKTKYIKGRFINHTFVPYYTREEINAGAIANKAPILGYANDPVELFFLHIQGSGRLITPDGQSIKLAYADKNEYPYQSIGTYMASKGYLSLHQTSMQGIKEYIRKNPHRMNEILGKNQSYVFFKFSEDVHTEGPIGALGVPLSAEYSAAVDRKFIPLGAPIFLATTDPRNNYALNRLIVAQDTGSAINGSVRVDFFWGYGEEPGTVAGRTNHTGYVWLLLPNGVKPNSF